MRNPEFQGEEPEKDIQNPDVQRALLFDQDPALMRPITEFATKIKSLPSDPGFPELEPQAVLVGGFVRDAMLGLHPKDADIEVLGVAPERLVNVLEQLFPGKVDKVGQQFGILKVRMTDAIEFDVSIPRRESKTGVGHTGFTTQSDPTMSIEEAARRRDFTWNALAADVLEGKVYDPFHGIEDLKNKLIRVTDPQTFVDDPLRVMRAVQFAGRMEMAIEPGSKKLMQEMVARGELNELPAERITGELEKLLLKAERPSVGFEAARELGIIEKHFPELHALVNTPQNPEFHPEGDVWIHTMMALDQAAKIIRDPSRGLEGQQKLEAMLGIVCHDLGKPATTEFQEDGRITQHGHEDAGNEPAKQMLSRLSFNHKIVQAVIAVTVDHLKPAQLHRELEKGLEPKKYVNAVRRLINRIAPVDWKVLLAVAEADSRGRTIPGCQTEPYLPGVEMIKAVTENQLDTVGKAKLIGGDDIFATAQSLGIDIKAGTQFGEYIRAIEELRDEHGLETKEEALEKLREFIQKDYGE